MRVLREVRCFLDHRPSATARGVVAVSGGADSVALLHSLHAVRTGALVVAHLNHRLRGTESDGDALFVQELAGRLGLACHVQEVDAAAAAAGANLEATARRLRYAFFRKVAAEEGAHWIATGHTADDQAETVLHRLIRGTGLQGLRGIPSVRGLEGVGTASSLVLIRPLLNVTRAEVEEYLSSVGQSYRNDSSNVDPRFTRNRIRHELLPQLKAFNPDIVSSLGQLAAQAGEAFEVLEADAGRLLKEVELPRAGSLVILEAVLAT